MAFVGIYDACVLYPAPLRDLLIRVAQKGLLRACWSNRILDECFAAVLRQRPDLDQSKLGRTRALMLEALPDALVEGYEPLMAGIDLPDEDDRHVLAAAIRCGAQMIVTFNTKDFPTAILEPFSVEAQHPDDFLVNQLHLNTGAVIGAVQQQAAALTNPCRTADDVLDALERGGIVEATGLLRGLLPR
jgi:predicted nucleic acid-binding protein